MNTHVVKGWDHTPNLKEQNKAIAMPEELTTKDGRIFEVLQWSAMVGKDELTVTATFRVRIPNE